MGAVVGIDLGTTNTVVAAARGGNVVALPDESGSTLIPSVVSFLPSGAVLVGNAANERRSIETRNTIYSIKRLIGRTWGSPEVEQAVTRFPFELREGPGRATFVIARGETYTLPEISAFVLRKAKSIAELELEESVDRAVITVPASFNDMQRAATKVAGRVAGLEILRVLNEPTAAALAFGHTHGNRECIAVYDLGGGTFDFTLLRLTDDVFEVLATAGDTYLGGDDIDAAIANQIARRASSLSGLDAKTHADTFERLRSAAEKVKVTLSTAPDARVRLRDYEIAAATDVEFSMNRSELDALEAPILDRTLEICRSALNDARISVRDIAQVLLVGGATRDPYVRQRAERFFERSVRSEIDAHEVVALGAARQAMALTQLRATASGIPIAPAPIQVHREPELPSLSRQRTDTGVGDMATVAPARISVPAPEQPPSPAAPTTQTLGSRDRRTTGIGIGPLMDPLPTAVRLSTLPSRGQKLETESGESTLAHPTLATITAAVPLQGGSASPGEATTDAAQTLLTGAVHQPAASDDTTSSANLLEDTQQKTSTAIIGSPAGVPADATGLHAARVSRTLATSLTKGGHQDLPATLAAAVVSASRSPQMASAASARDNASPQRIVDATGRDLPASMTSATVNRTAADHAGLASPPASNLGQAALGAAKPVPTRDLSTAIAPAIVDSPHVTAVGSGSKDKSAAAPPIRKTFGAYARDTAAGRGGIPAVHTPLDLPLVVGPQQKSPQLNSLWNASQHAMMAPSTQSLESPQARKSGLPAYDDANENEPTAIRNASPGSMESASDEASLPGPVSSLVDEVHESDWDLLAPAPRTPSEQQGPFPKLGTASSTPQVRLSEAEIRARYGDLPLIVGGRRVGATNVALPSSPAAAPSWRESSLPVHAADNPNVTTTLSSSKHDRRGPDIAEVGRQPKPQPGGEGGGQRSVETGISPPDEVTVTKRVQAPSLTEKSTPFTRPTKPLPFLSIEPEEVESEALDLLSASGPLESSQAGGLAADDQVQKPARIHSTRPSARQNIAELELPIPGVPQRPGNVGFNNFNKPSAVPDPIATSLSSAVDDSPLDLEQSKPSSRPGELRLMPEPIPTGISTRAATSPTVGTAAFGPALPLPGRSLPNTIGLPRATSDPVPPLPASVPKGTTPKALPFMDVTPLSLCVETVGGYVDVLISRNSTVPCERTCEFVTAHDNQQTVVIRIAQGESRYFRENALLGEVQLTGIPPRARAQSRIAVTFGIDSDGILHVHAIDRDTGLSALTDLRLSGATASIEIAQMTARQVNKGMQ